MLDPIAGQLHNHRSENDNSGVKDVKWAKKETITPEERGEGDDLGSALLLVYTKGALRGEQNCDARRTVSGG